ncbi:hypothetical protein TSUD_156070 [Trifolium subterraneum]|uniref:Uncharacterized protein n=1 Tax=Trifolium subterraneum TaxID=3900 RepID=A0A2Z6MM64_TRISU|nr:hypothetical protein TSUD_156070 [Trifolium subterraneum]
MPGVHFIDPPDITSHVGTVYARLGGSLVLTCEKWDDDVVFKNQARGETKLAKRFINDTIRNDFHRKFLHKYMK